MGFIAKKKLEILAALAIIFLFLFLRLSNLVVLPIFTDEAIYIRWAQIALQDPNWRFISLSDGKQPLFVWATMIMLKIFEDPLLAGRVVSVASGLVSLVGIWLVTFELFKRRSTAYLASLAYACYPFAQVADRMALYDSLSGALTVWSLYFAILLVRKVRLDLAYTLGISIGLGVLNKSTNFFSLYLLPFTILLIDFSKKGRMQRIAKWIGLVLIAVFISNGMYAVLRLSGLFHMVGQKNALFIFPYSEWINHPFDFFLGNLQGMTNWAIEYLKIPFIILILFSLKGNKFIKEKILLLLFAALPFLALALFARILFPRFIFFMTLSLLPLVAYGLHEFIDFVSMVFLKKNTNKFKHTFSFVVVFLFMMYPLYVSYQFAFDPMNSKIAKPDNAQYVNHWTSGWGVRESVALFESESKENEIFVATEGTFGLLPFSLEMYLDKNPNITIKGYWPLENELPKEVVDMSKKKKTFIVFYQPNNINPPNPEKLKLVIKVRAGNSKYFYRVYEVINNLALQSFSKNI